jgi:peptidoglycan L-alanyl-D-glutamate endopeptidase CwlK
MNSIKSLLKLVILIATMVVNYPSVANTEKLECLQRAYPNYIKKIIDSNTYENINGLKLAFSSSRTFVNYDDMLDNADLKAQLSQRYFVGKPNASPDIDFEPGRIRSDIFFRELYGSDKSNIEKSLVAVWWPPCNCKVFFNSKHGAAKALEALGEEIKSDEKIKLYLQKPNGTFNYRNIAGTKRLSPHSHGIAIDFTFPKNNEYWQWGKRVNGRVNFPTTAYENETLMKVVVAFEKYGFIWGGKWYHYDTIHFEYRPELVKFDCGG